MVLKAISATMPIQVPVGHVYFLLHQREKMEVPFSMAIRNEELVQECFPKHSPIGTARMKYDEEIKEEGFKRGLSVEKS